MDQDLERKILACERADTAEWDEVVVLAKKLSAEQKDYLREHPPGLVKALWAHFGATRDRCGCATPAHELATCEVPLIERLLRGEDEIA